jgi:hypothetical protein
MTLKTGCSLYMFLAEYLKKLDDISQGPKKGSISRDHPSPTVPRNESARIKNITHGAVLTTGAKIAIMHLIVVPLLM